MATLRDVASIIKAQKAVNFDLLEDSLLKQVGMLEWFTQQGIDGGL